MKKFMIWINNFFFQNETVILASMSWLADIAGKAENFLNKIDQVKKIAAFPGK